jgi:hypothetical protein
MPGYDNRDGFSRPISYRPSGSVRDYLRHSDSVCPYLGHSNIQHTVRYTELSPQRFKDFWR